MSIVLPTRFKEWLANDEGPSASKGLSAAVDASLTNFDAWINTDMPFFPYFTDHKSGHLTRVLNLADMLIRDGCSDADSTDEKEGIFSAADAACLTLAVLLHDAAMHLTEDSFLQIIRHGALLNRIEHFDKAEWPELWVDFLAEAKRWDAKKRQQVFGASEFHRLGDRSAIANLPDDTATWDTYDRLLGGEFIRRHHPRLAHEFALYGVPGDAESRLRIAVPPDFKPIGDLAGLIARSHGMPMREGMKYFEHADHKKYRREFKGVHVVYLMALLRVADYLDLYAERAPEGLRLMKRPKSRYSRGEWDAHAAIEDIRIGTDLDPEAVRVDAMPTKAADYLKIRGWLDGIQAQIDQSWAVLGEVYGEHPKMRKLGLSIRRVQSNIDDVEGFAQRKEVTYIPRAAKFDTAGGELLKLLVGPLYGDHPEVGIRELMQNAIDAVLELREWCRMNDKEMDALDLRQLEQDGDVEIAVCARGDGDAPYHKGVPDDWDYWVEVSDRGIGMTADTVVNYFLKAGASFRTDPAWGKQFADEEGESKVLRSGRFGIGIFAAFLLGDTICVSTRHAGAKPDEGLAFTAKVDQENIELKRIRRPSGTSVWVRIDKVLFEKLADENGKSYLGMDRCGGWSWFCLAEPHVVRIVRPEGHVLPQMCTLPTGPTEADSPWRLLPNVPSFEKVSWAYRQGYHMPHLACNGIVVGYHGGSGGASCDWKETAPFDMPHVAVLDPGGRLPLTIIRSELEARVFPFDRVLLAEVCRCYYAGFLVFAPTESQTHFIAPGWDEHWWGAPARRSRQIAPWVCNERGVIPRTGLHLHYAGVRCLLLASIEEPISLGGDEAVYTKVQSARLLVAASQASSMWGISELAFKAGKDYGSESVITLSGARVLHPSHWASLDELHRVGPDGAEEYRREWADESGRLVITAHGECDGDHDGLRAIASTSSLAQGMRRLDFIAEWHLADQQDDPPLLWEIWHDELRLPPIIPYDMAERREVCAYPFEKLEPYIRWHHAREEAARRKPAEDE